MVPRRVSSLPSKTNPIGPIVMFAGLPRISSMVFVGLLVFVVESYYLLIRVIDDVAVSV